MFSFIVPTLNEESHIGEVLSGLNPQLKKGDEIIVVDAQSKDRTAQIATKYGAKVVLQPKSGVGLARTVGAKNAKNDILVFLDADCNLSQDFAARLRKHFSRPEIVAVGGLDLYHSDSNVKGWVYNTYSVSVFHSAKITHKLTGKYWVPANNCAIRKNVFMSVGGYRSVICEDTDLMKRLPPNRDIVYDKKLVLTLSDRRFKQDGFVKTVALWGWSNISAFVNGGVDVMKGYTKE